MSEFWMILIRSECKLSSDNPPPPGAARRQSVEGGPLKFSSATPSGLMYALRLMKPPRYYSETGQTVRTQCETWTRRHHHSGSSIGGKSADIAQRISDYIMSVIFLTERDELVYAATFTSLDEVFGSTSRVRAMTNYRARRRRHRSVLIEAGPNRQRR